MIAIAERRLVVNADDFGLSPGVNRGILEAHAAGSVTSASLLANMPGFTEAVARLRTAPRLGVGLHLNLTVGTPVAPRAEVTSLWDPRTRTFYPLPRLVLRALTGRIEARQVAIECAAQIDRLRQAGVHLTHIDGHRHVQALPVIWSAVVGAARGAGVRAVRVPREPLRWPPGGAALKQAAVGAAWWVAARGDRAADLRAVRHFRGWSLGGAEMETRLLELLDRLPPGVTELMVHPGHADAELRDWDDYTTQREVELKALCSARVRQRLARDDIALVHFGDL